MLKPRMGWKSLSQMCRRLGTSLAAGIDLRSVLEREQGHGRAFHRRMMATVYRRVGRGDSLASALAASDDYFPILLVQMVDVGETTGQLEKILPRLADYYEHLLQLRRDFLVRIAWPVLQLSVAIVAIGLLILVLGWIGSSAGQTIDVLGFGLVGVPGLIKYLLVLGLIAAFGLVAYRVIFSRTMLPRVATWLIRVPGLGRALQLAALSRVCLTLGLTDGAGADAWDSVRLALRSTANDYYARHASEAEGRLRQGHDLSSTLSATGVFPPEFLHMLQTGEESGTISETMLRQADLYQDQARQAVAIVAHGATLLVWFLVATILILAIFRLFGFYAATLQDLASP